MMEGGCHDNNKHKNFIQIKTYKLYTNVKINSCKINS